MGKAVAKSQDILKMDLAQLAVAQINQICRVKSQYFCLCESLCKVAWSKVKREDPKSILVVDEPTLSVLGGYAGAKIVAALTDSRVPESKFATLKFLLEAYYNKEYPGLNVDVVRLTDILEGAMKMKHFDLVISNPPYGGIGTRITQKIVDCVDYGEFVNLLPANDYFDNGLYNHVADDPTIITDGFDDAAQTTTVCRLSKSAASHLTPVEARVKLHILERPSDDPMLHAALGEAFLAAEKAGMLSFSGRGDFRRRKAIAYDEGVFLFNAGAFDVHNGNLAVYNSREKDWTLATKYNLLGQSVPESAHSDMPGAKVRGCAQFKRLVYSELGLKTMRLWFSHSPEGWGLGANGSGMFADIDYSGCTSWEDYYRKLGVSEESIKVLIAEAEKIDLSSKEIEAAHLLD